MTHERVPAGADSDRYRQCQCEHHRYEHDNWLFGCQVPGCSCLTYRRAGADANSEQRKAQAKRILAAIFPAAHPDLTP